MKKLLNIKITQKGIFYFLIIFVLVAFVVSLPFTSEKLAAATGSTSGAVHGMAEKLYTIGMIALFALLGLSTMVIPILSAGFFALALTLVWHLTRKFK